MAAGRPITDTDRDFTVELALIKKFRISQKTLSEVIQVDARGMYDKINRKNGGRFTDAQKDKITKYLLAMGKVLVNSLGKKV